MSITSFMYILSTSHDNGYEKAKQLFIVTLQVRLLFTIRFAKIKIKNQINKAERNKNPLYFIFLRNGFLKNKTCNAITSQRWCQYYYYSWNFALMNLHRLKCTNVADYFFMTFKWNIMAIQKYYACLKKSKMHIIILVLKECQQQTVF